VKASQFHGFFDTNVAAILGMRGAFFKKPNWFQMGTGTKEIKKSEKCGIFIFINCLWLIWLSLNNYFQCLH
jgi:hypothetical protein